MTRRPRFAILLLVLLSVVGGVVVATASALDINQEVTMPDGLVGQPYEFQFEGEEGCQPYHFALKAGPPDL